jgi:2-oxoisovalerate dehydrogenase E2 component (dihydrolipoyl transacylase)
VPNIKNVQDLSILEIADELQRLKELGDKGQLQPSDLSGGTITCSNIGNIGGTLLHPVLVSGQVCIVAMGRMTRVPRFITENGVEKVAGVNILTVSLNADHRVIDGATAGRFVQLWKQYLESPALLSARLK